LLSLPQAIILFVVDCTSILIGFTSGVSFISNVPTSDQLFGTDDGLTPQFRLNHKYKSLDPSPYNKSNF
jgi:hypothetical protein